MYCHTAEVPHAKREYLEQVSPAALATQAWRPRWLAWSARSPPRAVWFETASRRTSADPEIADTLPGRPVALPTPWSHQRALLYVVDRVLIAGDALVTGHPLLRQSGPQLLPAMFNHSEAGAWRVWRCWLPRRPRC